MCIYIYVLNEKLAFRAENVVLFPSIKQPRFKDFWELRNWHWLWYNTIYIFVAGEYLRVYVYIYMASVWWRHVSLRVHIRATDHTRFYLFFFDAKRRQYTYTYTFSYVGGLWVVVIVRLVSNVYVCQDAIYVSTRFTTFIFHSSSPAPPSPAASQSSHATSNIASISRKSVYFSPAPQQQQQPISSVLAEPAAAHVLVALDARKWFVAHWVLEAELWANYILFALPLSLSLCLSFYLYCGAVAIDCFSNATRAVGGKFAASTPWQFT